MPVTDVKSRTPETQHMIKHITQPLQHKRGLEALRRIVTDTEYQMDLGKLRNPREVEVTLITSGKVGSSYTPYLTTILANCSLDALRISGSIREIS